MHTDDCPARLTNNRSQWPGLGVFETTEPAAKGRPPRPKGAVRRDAFSTSGVPPAHAELPCGRGSLRRGGLGEGIS